MTDDARHDHDHRPDPALVHARTLRTRLNKPWLVRTIGLLIGVTALAAWFAVDAWIVYPDRGRKAIKFAELQYLQQAQAASPVLMSGRVDVPEPAEELAALRQRRREGDAGRSSLESARFEWLTAISRLHALDAVGERNRAALRIRSGEPGTPPEGIITVFDDPAARLSALSSEIGQASVPKPLSRWDLPSQYAGLALCSAGGALLLLFFLRVRAQVYRYDPATMRLTLPDGFSFTPDQIESVDKRKWDKFIVFLTLRGESGERRIDLFRHAPLEEWVLEMERHSPGYVPDEEDQQDNQDDQAGTLQTE